MKKLISLLTMALVFVSSTAFGAYASRFDAINHDPAVDSTPYFTVYGSSTHKAWQGNLGLVLDYANRPLEFRGVGTTSGRQSILDHTFTVNVKGALGFTDWFTVGVNIPAVPYNHFFQDNATAASDHGGGMGDILVATKFRLVDIEKSKVGFALLPFATLPTGDIVRYNGNGHVTGGLVAILDARLHERFEMAVNAGYTMRDDVTRVFNFPGGSSSTIRVDDLFTFGGAGVVKFTKNLHGIVEVHGSTVMRNFFSDSNTTSLESGAGVRYHIGETGLSVHAGGTAGLIEGIGSPRFRGFAGLNWTSPGKKECPKCEDPRIQNNKIVLWGKIFYDTARWTIKPVSYPVLDDVVDVLNDHPEITLVEVQGHTDHRGSDSYNMELSQNRAQSAVDYLVSKGIASSRLRAVGYGESQPIATNATAEGMSQNRRTEFVIIESDGIYTSEPAQAQILEGSPETTAIPMVEDLVAQQ